MPYRVNGQLVPEPLLQEEFLRIGRDPQWNNISDLDERAWRIREAAEVAAQNRILIEQCAFSDPRSIESAQITEELARQAAQSGCRSVLNNYESRMLAERNLRLRRTRTEMLASAVAPHVEEVRAFFNANRSNFQRPTIFRASHIVQYVNKEQSEDQAEADIEAALDELEKGVPFSEVADKFSDCKDKGGDLGDGSVKYV